MAYSVCLCIPEILWLIEEATDLYNIQLGETTAEFGKFVADLAKQISPWDIRRALKDPSIIQRVAEIVRAGGHVPTTSQSTARNIMGENFLGIEEILGKHLLKVSALGPELDVIPFKVETLEKYKKSHVLIAKPALSIGQMVDICPNRFYSMFAGNIAGRYLIEKGKTSWHLVRTGEQGRHLGKTYDTQRDLLCQLEKPVPAQVMLWTMMVGFFIKGGYWLEKLGIVRCADRNLKQQGWPHEIEHISFQGTPASHEVFTFQLGRESDDSTRGPKTGNNINGTDLWLGSEIIPDLSV